MAPAERRTVRGILRAIRIAVDAALAIVLAVGLAATVALHIASATGHGIVIVTGGSMAPAIPLGSLALTRPITDADELAAGDVVTIQVAAGRAAVTHRVSRVIDRPDGRWLELRGDANAQPDAVLVPASAVVGRVVMRWPELGRWVAAFNGPAGIRVIVGLLGVLYATSLVLRSASNRRDRAPAGGNALQRHGGAPREAAIP